ncbi:MAG: hypothetical protein ACREJS_16675 [Candidatus Rokuibacteriota bacterium]
MLNVLRGLYPERVSSAELGARFGWSRAQALSVLADLIAAGAVQRVGG